MIADNMLEIPIGYGCAVVGSWFTDEGGPSGVTFTLLDKPHGKDLEEELDPHDSIFDKCASVFLVLRDRSACDLVIRKLEEARSFLPEIKEVSNEL